MGGFVVKPLQEELAESCQADKPLADARRCLEVLVPLAYRPAIKVQRLSHLCFVCSVLEAGKQQLVPGQLCSHICCMPFCAVTGC